MSKNHKHQKEQAGHDAEPEIVAVGTVDDDEVIEAEIVAVEDVAIVTDPKEKVDGLEPAWPTFKRIASQWYAHWQIFTGITLASTVALMLLSAIAGIGAVAAGAKLGLFDARVQPFQLMSNLLASPLLMAGLVLGGLILAAVAVVVSTWMALALVTAWRWVNDEEHHKMSVRNAFAASWPMVPSYIWIAILSGLIALMGLIGFIVPGILLGICFVVLPMIAVIEGRKGMDAIRRAIALVSPHLVGVLWRVVVTMVATYVPAAILAAIVSAIFGRGAGDLVDQAYQVVATPIVIGVMYVTYLEVKELGSEEGKSGLIRIALVAFAVAVALILGIALATA